MLMCFISSIRADFWVFAVCENLYETIQVLVHWRWRLQVRRSRMLSLKIFVLFCQILSRLSKVVETSFWAQKLAPFQSPNGILRISWKFQPKRMKNVGALGFWMQLRFSRTVNWDRYLRFCSFLAVFFSARIHILAAIEHKLLWLSPFIV